MFFDKLIENAKVIEDFAFRDGVLTAYVGSSGDVVIPASYSRVDTGSNVKTITLNGVHEIQAFYANEYYYNSMLFYAGQYYVTPTVNGETLEETFVTAGQVETYFDTLIENATTAGQDLSVEIKFTSYDVEFTDVATEAQFGAFMRPFLELSAGYLSSFSMKTGETEIYVTQENFEEQMSALETIFSQGFEVEDFPITYTYGNFFEFVEGDDIQVTSIEATMILNEGAFERALVESIVIPSSITSIANATFTDCTSLQEVTIESAEIYAQLLSDDACGGLVKNATTIKVLKTIVDDAGSENTFLTGDAFAEPAEEGEYYVFTKIYFQVNQKREPCILARFF